MSRFVCMELYNCTDTKIYIYIINSKILFLLKVLYFVKSEANL